jgi:hypothetical protein
MRSVLLLAMVATVLGADLTFLKTYGGSVRRCHLCSLNQGCEQETTTILPLPHVVMTAHFVLTCLQKSADIFYQTAILADGNVVAAGMSANWDPTPGTSLEIWVVKMDTNGDVLWSWTIGGVQNNQDLGYANALTPTKGDVH